MKLTDINLKGLGRFDDQPATFTVQKFHTPAGWEYQYYNDKSLLRLRSDGQAMVKLDPPGGALLLGYEKGAPPMFTWIAPADDPGTAFSNFYQPVLPSPAPGTEPTEYSCTFAPHAADYRLVHDNCRVETQVIYPEDEDAVVMTITLTNLSRKTRTFTLIPVVKPHLAAASQAIWDVPAWYQTSAFMPTSEGSAFWCEMRDAGGNAANRLRAAVLSSLKASSFEVNLDRFMGPAGRWELPKAVFDQRLALRPASAPAYGKVTTQNAASCQGIVAAIAKQVTLRGGKSITFTNIIGKLPATTDGTLPAKSSITKLTRFFKPEIRTREIKRQQAKYKKLLSLRSLKTPDEALNRYANELLAMQLYWVPNRGWAAVRGSRDTSQDVTAVIPVDPATARARMLEVFSYQRSDGWFLRQYATTGRDGKHDARPYVDSGIWVWELLWEYLLYTHDFKVLKEKVWWLDSNRKDTILEHALRTFDYYLNPKNIGEHGLCKIREGDWNDSVNAAGLLGRGETVMVTAQVVLGLRQAVTMLSALAERGVISALPNRVRQFSKSADAMTKAILKHSLNKDGYFSGVFNDAGQWVFSPKDPDGRGRINSTPNTFAIISGIATGRVREGVFKAMDKLKGPHGWRLFYPPIGHPPIKNFGRIGAGDLANGMFENGAPYNHGSHGFLARSACVAGKGDLAYEVMRYMLPYDQKAHPVNVSKCPPYLIVNSYLECMGMEGQGGFGFHTGSIPVAARNCYEGFLGVRPTLTHLGIDPVIPSRWKTCGGHITFKGARVEISIRNPKRSQSGVKRLLLDGQPIKDSWRDPILERKVHGIPVEAFKAGKTYKVEVEM